MIIINTLTYLIKKMEVKKQSMKNIKIRCRCEAIFEKEIIINDKNMSEKQLKEIIDEAKNNFIDEVENDLYYIGNKLQPYETIAREVTTIWNYERR